MNRVTKIQALSKINETELQLGITGELKKSWHQKYSDSAWIYVGNLPYDLNEGDILAVFSQYGEITNVNLVRDWKTGKSRGFSFVCYQDQRSTVLAVDNFNGIKLVGRVIQVDHVENYKIPKYKETVPEEIRRIWEEGCAPKPINIPEDQILIEAKKERKDRKKKIKELEQLVSLSEGDMSHELRKARKHLKKERKEFKKLKEREERLNRRSRTPDEERGKADDEGRWDQKKKKLDEYEMDDEKFYGSNDHFNFGNKKRKEVPPPPSHNVRPDFDKADWRDIELFKLVREHERREKGEKQVNWKPEDHYIPGRLQK